MAVIGTLAKVALLKEVAYTPLKLGFNACYRIKQHTKRFFLSQQRKRKEKKNHLLRFTAQVFSGK